MLKSHLESIRKIIKQYYSEFEEKQKRFITKNHEVPLATPPYGWQEVYEALESMLTMNTTMGQKVRKFEALFAKYIGTKYAVMVNSGSSANLLALSILSNPVFGNERIRKGDEVITPAVTWATTVYPIANIGAKSVFVDVDLRTYCIDPDRIEEAITNRTRAIMPVHLLGYPCNMNRINKIAKKHDLYIIEDTCEAHGAEFCGKKAGSFGDVGTFSFFASHHITTMEGGMLVTNNEKIFEIAKALRAFGWIRDLNNRNSLAKKYPKIDPRFLFINTGYNLRPTEIQGAFGIHQIKKLDQLIKIRITNATYWKKRLEKYSKFIVLPPDEKYHKNVYMTYPITVIKNEFFSKKDLVAVLEKRGIETRPVMAGNMIQQPAIKYIDYRINGGLKNSTYIADNSFLIGNHQGITPKLREHVADVISEFIERNITKTNL